MAARIRVGTAAWSDHVDFYPPGVRGTEKIVFYSQHFDIVEVNASYYAILPQRNYHRWAEQTPDDFRFNVKALANLTTHVRNEPATPEHFQAFRQSLQPLVDAGKLGALLFQFPPWFENTQANQAYIAHCVDQMGALPVLVEFRNVTWLDEDAVEVTLSMLAGIGASHVAVDAPQTGTGTTRLVSAVTNPDLAYLRLHGKNVDTWYQPSEVSGGRFNYNYSQQELESLASITRDLAGKAVELHIIFNNNVKGHGIQNAREIKRMLGLDVTEPPPRQARMNI